MKWAEALTCPNVKQREAKCIWMLLGQSLSLSPIHLAGLLRGERGNSVRCLSILGLKIKAQQTDHMQILPAIKNVLKFQTGFDRRWLGKTTTML